MLDWLLARKFPGPVLGDPYHRFGTREGSDVIGKRHQATYAALNRLAKLLDVSLPGNPPFVGMMGREDFFDSIDKLAQAAIQKLEPLTV